MVELDPAVLILHIIAGTIALAVHVISSLPPITILVIGVLVIVALLSNRPRVGLQQCSRRLRRR